MAREQDAHVHGKMRLYSVPLPRRHRPRMTYGLHFSVLESLQSIKIEQDANKEGRAKDRDIFRSTEGVG